MTTRMTKIEGLEIPSCYCGNTAFTTSSILDFGSCRLLRCTACQQLKTWPVPNPDYGSMDKYSADVAAYAERSALWHGFGAGIVGEVGKLVKPGKLLDVGCNLGELMEAARDLGWDAEGVEPNARAAAFVRSKGFTVHDQPLERLGLEPSSYSTIIINQVLEHIHDPHPLLTEARRLLRSGGVLFVSVPCLASPIPFLLKRERWYALVPQEHVWQFTPRTLDGLVTRKGFRVAHRIRGCSEFWGRPNRNPRTWVRWLVYRGVATSGWGDFDNVFYVPA